MSVMYSVIISNVSWIPEYLISGYVSYLEQKIGLLWCHFVGMCKEISCFVLFQWCRST